MVNVSNSSDQIGMPKPGGNRKSVWPYAKCQHQVGTVLFDAENRAVMLLVQREVGTAEELVRQCGSSAFIQHARVGGCDPNEFARPVAQEAEFSAFGAQHRQVGPIDVESFGENLDFAVRPRDLLCLRIGVESC